MTAADQTTLAGTSLARIRPKRELMRRRVFWAVTVLAAAAVVIVGVTRTNKTTTTGGPVASSTLAARTLLQLPASSVVTAAVQGDGAAFATDAQQNLVVRFNPATGRVERSFPVQGRPSAMVLHGNDLWVADATNNRLIQLDATTLTSVGTLALADSPTSLAILGDTLWVTSSNVTELTPISLHTAVVGTQIYVISGAVRAIEADGALWTTGTVNRLTRIVPSTTPGTPPAQKPAVVGDGPTAIAAGLGAIWVANTQSGTVSEVNPTTVAVTATFKVGGKPDSIAVEPDGRVLVGFSSGTSVVELKVGSPTQAQTQTLDVGTHPQQMQTVGNTVWVAGGTPGRVVSVAG